MSIRMLDKADRKYIENLLDEMEKNNDFCFEINVVENRKNGVITYLSITARPVEQCNFLEEK